MAEVTGMTPDKINQEITNIRSYVEGSLSEKVDKSYVDSVAPLKTFASVGSPEGVVEAPIGSVYTDTGATNGAIRWIKATGTESTGWVVDYGNTGIRDVKDLISTYVRGSATLTRIGDVVYLNAKNIIPQQTHDANNDSKIRIFNTLPDGFRPAIHDIFSVSTGLNKSTFRIFEMTSNNQILAWSPSLSDYYTFTRYWITEDSWPTTLPGTPA